MSIVVPATSGHLGRLIVTELLDRGVPAGDIVAGARNLDWAVSRILDRSSGLIRPRGLPRPGGR
jgi:NAD(P)H dehydrogenase (quinone)